MIALVEQPTDPAAPAPSEAPAPSTTPEPSPAPTVTATVTETVVISPTIAPADPICTTSEPCSMRLAGYSKDWTVVGVVSASLVVLLLAALVAAQLRRPR